MRKVERRGFFLSRVKRGPAGGSDYRALMSAERGPLPMKLPALFSGLTYAIVGGVATRMYQPERYTKDIDILITVDSVDDARARLSAGGGRLGIRLALADSALGLAGEVWNVPEIGEIDLLWSAEPWVSEAMTSLVLDEQGLAIIGLPYLVAMKLDASRSIDQGDLSRMLGFANDDALHSVRQVVGSLLPEIADDLESYIEIGRLEIGERSANAQDDD